MGAYKEPEKPLGRCDDERLAVVPLHLPAEQVEVLRGRRGVDDVHVDVCARAGLSIVCLVGQWLGEEVIGGRRTWSMRSIRIDECSGPAPSRPCGSRRKIPLCFSHFATATHQRSACSPRM